MEYSVEREIGGKNLTLTTGKFANQANAAVTVRYGDSILLATACVSREPRSGIDFLPLTVDYEERHYAAGKIPGSFFRREGRPGQEAVLFGRLTDRPLRPLFPKGFYNDVQIVITVLSVDKENPPEVLGIIGASAALSISSIPFDGPVGASRVSHSNGAYSVNPTYAEINQSDLSVVVAGTKDAVMMVEAASNEVPEETVLESIRRAQEAARQVIEMIGELVAARGKPKIRFETQTSNLQVEAEVNASLDGRLSTVLEAGGDKADRDQALHDLEAAVRERLVEQHGEEEVAVAFESVVKRAMRARILDSGIRPDGRGLTDIRPLSCEVGVLPRTHGSGLFTRGETQVLTTATLASLAMHQIVDSLSPEDTKRFMHHYNFPPFSVNEVKRLGTGRREIGHGALAERAISVMVPGEDEFPYAIRLVSEVLSSNGSTSMASVCGSSLALMDAGVPLKSPVAGVAMGLVIGEDGRSSILTDIEGMEDHLGDMDFKVAGTRRGINALQMDIKTKGLTQEVLERALAQAKEGRLFILAKMEEVIAEPSPHLSQYAPKMFRMMIPVDKIGALIGPGGKNIRGIQEETGASIDVEDDGAVVIGSSDDAMLQRAKDRVDALTRQIAVGDVFTGKVVRVTSFGAFVELLPGKDGLVRMGDMGDVEDGLTVGQEITVIVQEIDSLGRINLSRRALFENDDGPDDAGRSPQRPPQQPFRQGGPPSGDRRPGQRVDRRPLPGQTGPRPGANQGRRPPQGQSFRGRPGR
jgi:polyribonucleotide nucleotidyltransferase